MFQEFYAQSEHLVWPLIGLIIFVAIFVGVLAYVFLGLRDRRKIDEIAALPLDDSEEEISTGR
ncbi:cbb3-type cytochrome c oxidase subunit 3 [bacterium]|nr:cbb3-type cytochrome c oxidase subunit 3 [bacterium]